MCYEVSCVHTCTRDFLPHLRSIFVRIFIISYPLSFIRKENFTISVKLSYLLTRTRSSSLSQAQCLHNCLINDLSSCKPITRSGWDWVKRQPPMPLIKGRLTDYVSFWNLIIHIPSCLEYMMNLFNICFICRANVGAAWHDLETVSMKQPTVVLFLVPVYSQICHVSRSTMIRVQLAAPSEAATTRGWPM